MLPPPPRSPDTVVVDTVLVRVPQARSNELHDLWLAADEAVLPLELRKHLDRNGLRAGVVLGELPKLIRDQLNSVSAKQTTDVLEHAGLAADVDNRMRQLRCRSGRPKDLWVRSETSETLTILSATETGSVAGETFERPTMMFDLRAVPHGDGSATIQLKPIVQHGQQRQDYISTEFGVRPEIKRAQHSYDNLAIDVRMTPGQVLAVSSTLPPKAVGSAFFVTETAENTRENVVLLIRLGETQLDELFAPELTEQARAIAERQ